MYIGKRVGSFYLGTRTHWLIALWVTISYGIINAMRRGAATKRRVESARMPASVVERHEYEQYCDSCDEWYGPEGFNHSRCRYYGKANRR